IVDSDPIVHELMREILTSKMSIDSARTLDEAMKLCWEREYTLILTEIQFAETQSAINFIEKIKRKMPNTQIVVMTGKATVENAVAALRAGAMDFLTKPFSIEDIALLIEKFFLITNIRETDYSLLDAMIEEKRSFALPTDFSLINPFLNEMMTIITRFPGMNKKILLIIRLSVYEMLVNAMEHGNLEIDYQMKKDLLEEVTDYQEYLQKRAANEPFLSRKVWLSYHYETTQISFTITDEGKGFDVSKIPSPRDEENMENLNGRGIFITRVNMDAITYNDKGNIVRLVKILNPAEE
ncbi:MAG: response regulator, partial [Leptospiraceae bacterium]|nr:response regulator [Leptospiraceae bacterium]